MIFGKTFDELMESSINYLINNSPITNFNRGAIARAILECINQNIADYYTTLDFNMTMAFLSTASGSYLDLIGYLLNCTRLDGEDDDDYRYRISQQVYVVAGANETAIRLACLSVPKVRDVIIREFTYGTGSFSVYVIPESSSDLEEVLTSVQAVLDEKKAEGIKGVAVAPKMIRIDLRIRLIGRTGTISDDIKTEVRRQLIYYIEDSGTEFIINEAIQRIMDVSDNIKDMQFIEFYVDGKPSLLTNRTLYWDEKFYPGSIIVE